MSFVLTRLPTLRARLSIVGVLVLAGLSVLSTGASASPTDPSPAAIPGTGATFNADGVRVDSLHVSTSSAVVGAPVTVTYSVTTNRAIRFEYLTGAVRDSRDIDGPALDFADQRRVTIEGTRTFTSARSWSEAEDYTIHVAYSIDGEHWTHMDSPSARVRVTASAPPTPAPSPTGEPTSGASATATDNSPGWLSGGSGPDAARGGFGAWRGSPVEIGGTWPNHPALYAMTGSGELVDFDGPVDVGLSPSDWKGWQAEANGVHDDFYRQVFTNLRSVRAGKGTVYVRPWYELNGRWMPWYVPPGQETLFRQAWIRMAGIARSAFPDVQLVFCASAARGANVFSLFPGRRYVDVGGIDFYNNWPFVTTQAAFDDKIMNGADAYSMEKLRRFYEAQGIPFAVNEWSNQGASRPASAGGGGESPQFVRSMYDYFRSHAGTGPGQLLYEVQFNLWPNSFQLFPADRTVQPRTAAEYARVF